MSDALTAFRTNVVRLMKAQDIRQAALAKAAGLHQGNLSAYLSGKKEASVPVIERIAHALGVPAFQLLMSEEQRALLRQSQSPGNAPASVAELAESQKALEERLRVLEEDAVLKRALATARELMASEKAKKDVG
jgi:transcriptional regulator with XRE-family HTH domain